MRKMLSLLLLAAMGLSCLCACETKKIPDTESESDSSAAAQEETSVAETDAQTSEQEKLLTFIKDGTANCQIIYSLSDAGSENAAYTIGTAIKTSLGVKTVSVKRDGSVDYDANALEILVGKTNRPESTAAAKDAAREKDYLIGVYGNKLVILGNTSELLKKAADLFVSLLVTGKTELCVKPDYRQIRLGAYPLLPGTVGGVSFSEYTIVYPKNSYNGELYAALNLQKWIYEKGGYFLPLKDDSAAATANEILVGKTNRTTLAEPSENRYRVEINGTKVQAVASGLNGYTALSSALQNKVFKVGQKLALTDGLIDEGSATTLIDSERKGAYRVMWHNIWYHDAVAEINNGQKTFGINTVNYEVAHIKSYNPDVVGFNEFYDQWRNMTDMVAAMSSIGYTEARCASDDRNYMVPIFYKAEKLDLLDCQWYSAGEITYSNGGASFSVNHNSNTRWRGVLIAAFEDKATKDRFIVACVHLESNWAVVNQTADNGDPVRAEEITSTVLPALNAMQTKWNNIPIMMGGDYNSVSSRVACTLLEDDGFLNAHNHAAVTNNICSCHGYPGYSGKFNAFITPASVGNGYTSGIDQIFARGSNLVLKQFRTMDDSLPKYVSDHCPVMLDFDLSTNK